MSAGRSDLPAEKQMSSNRDRSLRSLLAVALLTLAGCPHRGIETHPWNIQATSGGVPLWQRATEILLLPISGTGQLLSPSSLQITNAVLETGSGTESLADVVLTFEARDTGVHLPDPAGADVQVLVLVDPNGKGPTKQPLQTPGFLLYGPTTTGLRPVFQMFEGAYRPVATDTTATIYNFLSIPTAEVAQQWIRFEPDACGPVYYDDIVVFGWNEDASLEPGQEKHIVSQSDPDPTDEVAVPTEAWTFHHELSWHRDGACSDQAAVWTQLAAWFDAP